MNFVNCNTNKLNSVDMPFPGRFSLRNSDPELQGDFFTSTLRPLDLKHRAPDFLVESALFWGPFVCWDTSLVAAGASCPSFF